jgi:hypothetical protein
MSVPAPVSQSELTRAAKVAAATGAEITIQVGAKIYIIRPTTSSTPVDVGKDIRL